MWVPLSAATTRQPKPNQKCVFEAASHRAWVAGRASCAPGIRHDRHELLEVCEASGFGLLCRLNILGIMKDLKHANNEKSKLPLPKHGNMVMQIG